MRVQIDKPTAWPTTSDGPSAAFRSRIPDQQYLSSIPAKPAANRCCPYCNRPAEQHRGSGVINALVNGIRQLFLALCGLLLSILRFARFVVALGMCAVGFVGGVFQRTGQRIAHADDRKFLSRLSTARQP